MLRADDLDRNITQIDGCWVYARPLRAPFKQRLRDAWEVLRGRADAVKFFRQ